ncbi:hypothetical protein MAR_014185, partial [Mya arenaria]
PTLTTDIYTEVRWWTLLCDSRMQSFTLAALALIACVGMTMAYGYGYAPIPVQGGGGGIGGDGGLLMLIGLLFVLMLLFSNNSFFNSTSTVTPVTIVQELLTHADNIRLGRPRDKSSGKPRDTHYLLLSLLLNKS